MSKSSLVIICAWCKKQISKPCKKKSGVSHGICNKCRDEIIKFHKFEPNVKYNTVIWTPTDCS